MLSEVYCFRWHQFALDLQEKCAHLFELSRMKFLKQSNIILVDCSHSFCLLGVGRFLLG